MKARICKSICGLFALCFSMSCVTPYDFDTFEGIPSRSWATSGDDLSLHSEYNRGDLSISVRSFGISLNTQKFGFLITINTNSYAVHPELAIVECYNYDSGMKFSSFSLKEKFGQSVISPKSVSQFLLQIEAEADEVNHCVIKLDKAIDGTERISDLTLKRVHRHGRRFLDF